MSFQELIDASQKYFPDLQVKYKDQSWFMKLLGTILFFNKDFMKSYTTTIGSTVYFPSQSFIKVRPVSGAIILLHELMHIKDAHKYSKPLFGFLYLTPQILALLCLPLLFISWPIALLTLLFAAPIPSFFRMYFEKRAYFVSLYVLNALGKTQNFNPQLDKQKQSYLAQFKTSYYYYMWPFNNLDKQFDQAIEKITMGQRPFEDPMFDILDDLIPKV